MFKILFVWNKIRCHWKLSKNISSSLCEVMESFVLKSLKKQQTNSNQIICSNDIMFCDLKSFNFK